MSNVWPLQDAKNRLSEVVNKAIADRPQVTSRHGVETVIVLSYAEYRALVLRQQSLSQFFRESPLAGEDLDLAHNRSGLREAKEL